MLQFFEYICVCILDACMQHARLDKVCGGFFRVSTTTRARLLLWDYCILIHFFTCIGVVVVVVVVVALTKRWPRTGDQWVRPVGAL